METQESAGKSCIMATRNMRHPDQCPISSIREMSLTILTNALATSRNWFRFSVFSRAHTRFWYIKSEKRPKEGGWERGKGGGEKWKDIVSMAMKRL